VKKLPNSIIKFDPYVRGKMFGRTGPHQWIRDTSSDRWIPNIKCPFMVWVAKDDKITEYRHVPREDLLRNKNCILVEAQHGGHCDFFTKNDAGTGYFKFKRSSSDIIIKYFDSVNEFNQQES